MQVVTPFAKRIERPSCRCGSYMRIWAVEPLVADSAREAHIYFCEGCGHKLHLLHAASEETEPTA